MRKIYHTLTIILLVAVSCSLQDMDLIPGPRRNDTEKAGARGNGTGGGEGQEAIVPKDTILYVSAVAFPKGYNWQRDSACGGGNLQLYRNGKLVLEETVSYGNCVSEAADMHRIIDGHLVSDYSTDSETVIKVDGKEKVRYAGREMIAGILIREDGIWTLGEMRDLSGLKLRKNGEEVFTSFCRVVPDVNPTTVADARLYEDEGDICFAMTGISGGGKGLYYIVVNGDQKLLELPSAMNKVYDIRRIGGETSILGSGPGMVLGISTEGNTVSCGFGYASRDFRFAFDSSGKMYTYGYLRRNSTVGFNPAIWEPGSSPVLASGEIQLLYMAKDGGNTAVIRAGEGRAVKEACLNLYQLELPFGCRLMSPRAAELTGGRLVMGLTPYSLSERPVVWTRDSLFRYDINGYLTGVQTIIKEK